MRRAALPLAWVLYGAVASAQTAPADPVDEHLRRGVDLRRGGRDDEALTEFEAAYTLRREPRTAAQLGLACQAAGQWVRADALLREALAAPTDPWVSRNRAALDGARDVVARHLATVDLVGDVDGARVQVNGVDAGVLPLAAPLRVLAGTVVVDVTAPGYDPLTVRFVAGAGETLRERLHLVATARATSTAGAPSTPPPRPEPTPSPVAHPESTAPWRAVAIGGLSLAAASLVAGGVTLALGEAQASEYNTRCDAGDARGECGDLRDGAASLRAASAVTLPLGAILGAAGAWMLLRGGRGAHGGVAARCAVGWQSVQCGVTF